MSYLIAFALLTASSNLQTETKSQAFSLTPEEMVFASKLSDENRHKFCYTFSTQERGLALQEAKDTSPNESVEKVVALQD